MTSVDSDLCLYCYDKKNMNIFKCRTCNSSLCVDCLLKISRDVFNIEKKIMEMKFKCPMCRDNDVYTYNDFEKEDIITIANLHLYQYHDFFIEKEIKTKTEKLEKQIIDLNNKIKNYKNQLDEQNNKIKIKEQDHKEQLLFISKCMENQNNNIKLLCESSKSKTIKKNLLTSLYINKIDICLKL